jgi:hypothetical protein
MLLSQHSKQSDFNRRITDSFPITFNLIQVSAASVQSMTRAVANQHHLNAIVVMGFDRVTAMADFNRRRFTEATKDRRSYLGAVIFIAPNLIYDIIINND